VRLSELLGLEVQTESGRVLGDLHDLRGELTDREVAVTGLVIGGMGILERLGLRGLRRDGRAGRPFVAWDAVVRLDRRGIVVRDDAAE
jgi:sporulation protein YlmC with PRC-barrel domain